MPQIDLVGKRWLQTESIEDSQGLARAFGLIAWTRDPLLSIGAHTQASTKAVGVLLTQGTTITFLSTVVTIIGVTPASGSFGIYQATPLSFSATGSVALVASTASATTPWYSLGIVELPLTTPYVVPVTGIYYLASQYTVGAGTLPTVLDYTYALGQSFLPGNMLRLVYGNAVTTLANPLVNSTFSTQYPCIMAR